MSINSREKGAGFERAVARMFREHGYEAHRTAQHKGNTGDAADVEGNYYGIHIEAKAYKRIAVYNWMAQAIRDANAEGKGNKPVVIMKENYGDPLVLMRFSDWIELYREWEASESFKRGDNDENKT